MVRDKIKFRNISDLPVRITDWVGSTASLFIHTLLFVAIFVLYLGGVGIDKVMLILTTAVSLEAIYLSIFIQMTVNRNTQSLEEVEEDIEEITGDIDKLEEEDVKDSVHDEATAKTLNKIESDLQRLVEDIARLRQT